MPTRFRDAALLLTCVLVSANCREPKDSGAGRNSILMDFTRSSSLYAAPFPSDDLLDESGHVRIDAFPNPDDIPLVTQAKALLAGDARGFAMTGGIFFQVELDAVAGDEWPWRPMYPSDAGGRDARAALVDVDPASPELGRVYPVEASYLENGGKFGARRLLSFRPLQGVPLRPHTRYAMAVGSTFFFPGGKASAQLVQLQRGEKPAGMSQLAFERYRDAIDVLDKHAGFLSDLIGLAVFTTDDSTAVQSAAVRDALSRPLPTPTAFTAAEVFDDYCVYRSTLGVPVYQSGTPPYQNSGGDWLVDASGTPKLQREEEANLVVTIPRQPMPETGWPTVVFIPTGGGGERPLVDRGRRSVAGGEAVTPGTGPALEFARSGYAGVSLDGPHGGLRNVTHGDEQFLMFNILNPAALRDNVRQAALEQALLAHVLQNVTFDVSACVGTTSTAKFDAAHFALMGHSMGATIAPLTLATEPLYSASILSGAGGSYIENVLHKRKPLEVKPLAELMLGYDPGTLHRHDPVLTLVQWAAEPADTQVYARRIVAEPRAGEQPRHVLMLQGIVDHYIPPRIANTLSLSMGLDGAGAQRDTDHPDMPPDQIPLSNWLPWTGREWRPLPVQGNVTVNGAAATAVVTQHLQDGVEDGHEVAFQTDAPKAQYRCFLKSWRNGVPKVAESCDP